MSVLYNRGFPPPLPEGATAQVEETPQGVRVTLRMLGCARWVMVGFLGFWLLGWAGGEMFALGLLFKVFTGQSRSASGMEPWFLGMWLTLWTFGGFFAIRTLVRMAGAAERILIRPDGVEVGQGPWGKPRFVPNEQIRRVATRPNPPQVVLETDRGSIPVSSGGNESDRAWLQNALRQAVGQREEPPAGAIAPRRPLTEPALPAGWIQEPQADGSIALRITSEKRVKTVLVLGGIALFWNGVVGMVGGGFLRSMPGRGPYGIWINLGIGLFFLPFVAIGLALAFSVVWTLLGREETRVARGSLVRRWRLIGFAGGQEYTEGEFRLKTTTDSEASSSYSLVLMSPGKKEQTLDNGDPAVLRSLGEYLAYQTGWEFQTLGNA